MADARHVDATRRNVGRHQRPHAAAAHLLQRSRAFALVHVAVQCGGGMAFAPQPLREGLRVALGRDEDDALRDRDVGEQVIENPMLVRMIVGEMDALLDRDGRGLVGLHLDAHGIAHQACRQPRDRAVERRREQHGLAGLRCEQRDALDIVDEAHVEHPVGLVEDQRLQRRKIDPAALEVVDETARCGNDDLGAAREIAVLYRVRCPAVDADGLDPEAAAVAQRLLGDLLRQLARRSEHQDARGRDAMATCAGAHSRRGEPLQRRQYERRRLAGAGLRRADQVASGEQMRNRLRLDRRGLRVTACGKRLEQFGPKMEFFEFHFRFLRFAPAATVRRRGHGQDPGPAVAVARSQEIRDCGNERGTARRPRANFAVSTDASGARKEPQPGRQTAKPSSLTGCRRSVPTCRENEPRD